MPWSGHTTLSPERRGRLVIVQTARRIGPWGPGVPEDVLTELQMHILHERDLAMMRRDTMNAAMSQLAGATGIAVSLDGDVQILRRKRRARKAKAK